ncbi:hypothetical protein LYNGBM3L_20930 [Moorena producens 3L]|uniref:Uncharacterized protein n=1 Tax=Moorena producens 3L TaxID=489825 RepID=F4XN19_9CYAN|nr:hypothetical protein LYNGBM3L_20930 [Moorena producens 3L]
MKAPQVAWPMAKAKAEFFGIHGFCLQTLYFVSSYCMQL